MTTDLDRALAVLGLLSLRLVPALAWLGWAARSVSLAVVLGFGASLSLWPLAIAIVPIEDARFSRLWSAAPWELARGVTLGLGGLLPLLAIGWAGRISDALRDVDARTDDLAGFALERLYVAGALAVLFASGAHASVFSALGDSLLEVPLGTGAASTPGVQIALLELAKLLARAFEIGVVCAAPVFLIVFTSALIAGLTSRLSAPFGTALLRVPLLPVVGLSAACLCISSILGEYPRLAQVFVDETSALLRGLF